jgi:uncharacterized protein (DUF433 family)
MTVEEIKKSLEALDPVERGEVLDFVLFLKHKHLGPGIEKTPGVCGGEACVAGTRIAVWMLEEARRAGATDQDLLQDYPGLDAKRLSESWSYAQDHPEEIERAIAENALA